MLKNLWNTKLNVLPHLNTGQPWKWNLGWYLAGIYNSTKIWKAALSFTLSSRKLRKRRAEEGGRAAAATEAVGVGSTQPCYQTDKGTAKNYCWYIHGSTSEDVSLGTELHHTLVSHVWCFFPQWLFQGMWEQNEHRNTLLLTHLFP